jgi:hypothetical protein
MTDATATKAKAKARGRKPTNFALGWKTSTAPELDEDGNEVEGSSRTCIVLMNLPPGLDDAQKRSRDSIARACKRAVYELGMEEFGSPETGNLEEDQKNKKELVVVSLGEPFVLPYQKTTVTRLLPPDKAEKAKTENGKGAVVTTDPPEQPTAAVLDDDDGSDGEDDVSV